MNSGPRRPQAFLEVCLCSGLPTQVLVAGILFMAGVSPGPAGQLNLPFVAWLGALDTLLLVGIVVALLRAGGESPRQVILGSRTIGGEVVRGLLLLPWVLAIVAVTGLALLKFAPGLFPPSNPFAGLASTRTGMLVFAATAIVAGGVREEIQRAFILHRFEQRLGGAAVGLAVFSLAFGAGHVLQGWSAAIITALLGALWGAAYLMRRSVIAPMVSHASFNLIMVSGFGLAT